jgi:hypothetical protein
MIRRLPRLVEQREGWQRCNRLHYAIDHVRYGVFGHVHRSPGSTALTVTPLP